MDMKEATAVIGMLIGVLSLLGVGGWFAWHLKPKVQKDIDTLTRDKMVQEAASLAATANQAVIEALTGNIATFVAQNKVLETELKATQEKTRGEAHKLQTRVSELETLVEATRSDMQGQIDNIKHDLDAWQWSVRQEPQETAIRIEERARARRVARQGKTDD